jgi:hypothetical protein
MGWFAITILIPLVAPIVFLAVFWALPLPSSVAPQLKLLVPIKDGQLCWGSMGFCVSALYEIAEPGSGRRLDPSIVGWANAGFTALLLLSAFWAAGGSVFSTQLGVPTGVHWTKHYVTLLASLVLTVIAAGSYTVVHFYVSGS